MRQFYKIRQVLTKLGEEIEIMPNEFIEHTEFDEGQLRVFIATLIVKED